MTTPRPAVAPGRGNTWRPRTRGEHLVRVAGCSRRKQRDSKCSALGLFYGDCSQRRVSGSAYCYYHDKVQREVITSFRKTNSAGEWVDTSPRFIYPVYPLPTSGYVLLYKETSVE